MSWIKQHAPSIEAIAAALTAVVALLALVGVKLQIDAAQHQTLEQGARDLYREHLALSMQYPEFGDPGSCPAFDAAKQTAYTAYVTHLIYTAEETSAADPSWQPVMEDALRPHGALICDSFETDTTLTDPVAKMLRKISFMQCDDLPVCE